MRYYTSDLAVIINNNCYPQEAVAMLLEELDGEKAKKDVTQLQVGLEEVCDRAKGLGRKRVTP